MRFGTSGSTSAPVDDTTVRSSTSMPGRAATSEPVAMTTLLVSTVSVEPSSFVTRTRCVPSPRPSIEPRPWNVSTLFFLNR